MMPLSQSQLDAMSEAQEVEMATQLQDYFSQRFEELSRRFPQRLGVDVIRRSFERARHYGFTDDEQVGKFALLSFVLGEDFDLEPRNHFVLLEPLWHPVTRLDHILCWIEVQAQRAAAYERVR